MLLQVDVLPLLGVIVLVLIAAALMLWGVAVLRRRLREPDHASPIGFTLSDLRQLHRSGQMTDAEFERAKEKLLSSARAPAAPATRAQAPPPRQT